MSTKTISNALLEAISRKKAATQAERDALPIKAIKAKFDWTNKDWAIAWLSRVRLAVAILSKDERELTEAVSGFIKDGTLPDLLDELVRAKDHFKALIETIDAALTRNFLVLERLGFSPDNPPPDHPMSVQ